VGALSYAVFLASLTIGRWLGPKFIDRWGRVTALRTGASVAVVGVVLFVLGPTIGAAFAGTLLWGMGAASVFPSA
jgi:hypothetical protein